MADDDLDLPDPDWLDLDLPDLDLPDPDATTLTDLAQRYAPDGPLAALSDRGRRPPRWDDPRVLTLLGHLETGLPLTEAIAASRLAERTVYRWLERGRADDDLDPECLAPVTVYRHIWQASMRAQAVPEVRALQVIQRAASRGGWRAAAWFLERRYPDHWGRNGTAWQRERLDHDQAVPTRDEVTERILTLLDALDAETA